MSSKYLTDKVLDDVSKDKFGHSDLADEIWEIIKSQETPLHIGIFGKWGVGKSTIVGFIEKKISKLKKVKYVNINVWKYDSSGLRRKFILDISNELGIPIQNKYNKIVNGAGILLLARLRKYWIKIRAKISWVSIGSTLFLIPFVCFVFFLLVQTFIKDLSWFAGVLSSVSVFGMASVIMVFIYSILQLIISSSTSVTTQPFESEEQFETEFKELVKEYLENNEAEKIVIFIDDLDRCNHLKVINTLETIKTFLNIHGCIFLIACDPDVVVRAVIESNKILGFTQRDGAYYLEKFFQHVVFIPPFIPDNMREFARILIEGPPKLSIIKDINDPGILDDVIFILAYEDVVNPRKMISLINSFISEYNISKAREASDNSLLPGTITDDVRPLAILTVLKQDFPFAYEDLLKQPRLLEYIKMQKAQEINDLGIREKYTNELVSLNGEKVYPNKDDILKLREFIGLLGTGWLKIDILPYIYLTLDKSFDGINGILDNPREFDKAIRDNDYHEVKAIIDGVRNR